MGSRVVVFTSAAVNYLPKVRILARSVREHHPEFEFWLALADKRPDWLDSDKEGFDRVLAVEDLEIEAQPSWTFRHNVVELSTAIKPFVLKHLLSQPGLDAVIYLDPDIVLFSRIDEIVQSLAICDLVLTPHVTVPEGSIDGILDNEVGSLRHGLYNLGFLGVRSGKEGMAFADWWAARVYHFCQESWSEGLFTDQKWVDLAPIFFQSVKIERSPRMNVAPWNLSTRHLAGSFEDGFTIDGHPLGFYHFTGFDSGAHGVMSWKHSKGSGSVEALVRWYERCAEAESEDRVLAWRWPFGEFTNGEPITPAHRMVYRLRRDLHQRFPDPFLAPSDGPSYQRWFESHGRREHARLIRMAAARDPDTERWSFRDASPGLSLGRLGSYMREGLRDPRRLRSLADKAWQILKSEGPRGLASRLRRRGAEPLDPPPP